MTNQTQRSLGVTSKQNEPRASTRRDTQTYHTSANGSNEARGIGDKIPFGRISKDALLGPGLGRARRSSGWAGFNIPDNPEMSPFAQVESWAHLPIRCRRWEASSGGKTPARNWSLRGLWRPCWTLGRWREHWQEKGNKDIKQHTHGGKK